MRRITVEEVRKARELTGSERVRGAWTGPGCGSCALTCLAWVEATDKQRKLDPMIWKTGQAQGGILGLGHDYLLGFARGYDSSQDWLGKESKFYLGYKDGMAVYEAGF